MQHRSSTTRSRIATQPAAGRRAAARQQTPDLVAMTLRLAVAVAEAQSPLLFLAVRLRGLVY